MATYSQLKVFKETYDLLMLIYQATSNVNREYRYTLVEKIKNDVTELCIIIYRANLAKDHKIREINTAREMLVRVNIQCRMLGDMRQISTKLQAQITLHTQAIYEQLEAWYKYNQTKDDRTDDGDNGSVQSSQEK
ncbi:MAG: four helix bundle protein [Mucinivorans sp.]